MYNRNYINHPLNKSPSKQAWSFGQAERFKNNCDAQKTEEDNKSTTSRRRKYQSAEDKSEVRSTYSSYAK